MMCTYFLTKRYTPKAVEIEAEDVHRKKTVDLEAGDAIEAVQKKHHKEVLLGSRCGLKAAVTHERCFGSLFKLALSFHCIQTYQQHSCNV